MNNTGSLFIIFLILIVFGTIVSAQKIEPYPKNAEDVTALVEILSQSEFSAQDAFKLFGTVDKDEYTTEDWAITLAPFPSDVERIESVRIDTFDEQSKLDSVEILYTEPILISFGKLKQLFGKPKLLPIPKIICQSGSNDCRPAFVGYDFTFTPDPKKPNAAKKLKVFIQINTEWSKVVPKLTDKDFLKVKSIRFKRNTPDED